MKKKKPGPKGPRPDSIASLFRKLISEGKTDMQIRRAVKRKFPKAQLVTKAGKSVIGWHRWKYQKEMSND